MLGSNRNFHKYKKSKNLVEIKDDRVSKNMSYLEKRYKIHNFYDCLSFIYIKL